MAKLRSSALAIRGAFLLSYTHAQTLEGGKRQYEVIGVAAGKHDPHVRSSPERNVCTKEER